MSKIEKLGIDVSYCQRVIDWEKVKASGIQFAIIRCGYGKDYPHQDDDQWARNVSECERLGIPYGVYHYSYATSVEAAKSEAAHVLRLLKGHKPQYPVYYDLEDPGTTGRQSNATILAIAKTWVEAIEEAGYTAGIYANYHWHNTKLTDGWYDTKPRWVAQYNETCDLKKPYQIWQYSSKGHVDGIAGNVDMNYCYHEYIAQSEPEKPTAPEKTVDELAHEVLNGQWGNGAERQTRLTNAGYDYDAVQKRVNAILLGDEAEKEDIPAEPEKPSVTVEQAARMIIRGELGNGRARKVAVEALGLNYDEVQRRVNTLIG